MNASNRMQINLNQTKSLLAQQKQLSILSRIGQKRPAATPAGPTLITPEQTAANTTDSSAISAVRHITEKEFASEPKTIKQELIDEGLADEEEEELEEGLDESETNGAADSTAAATAGEKSGMFAEFEDHQSVVSNNNNKSSNNADNRSDEEEDSLDDEPMDTSALSSMGHILAKVPPGTSISTTLHSGDQPPDPLRSDNIIGIYLCF